MVQRYDRTLLKDGIRAVFVGPLSQNMLLVHGRSHDHLVRPMKRRLEVSQDGAADQKQRHQLNPLTYQKVSLPFLKPNIHGPSMGFRPPSIISPTRLDPLELGAACCEPTVDGSCRSCD